MAKMIDRSKNRGEEQIRTQPKPTMWFASFTIPQIDDGDESDDPRHEETWRAELDQAESWLREVAGFAGTGALAIPTSSIDVPREMTIEAVFSSRLPRAELKRTWNAQFGRSTADLALRIISPRWIVLAKLALALLPTVKEKQQLSAKRSVLLTAGDLARGHLDVWGPLRKTSLKRHRKAFEALIRQGSWLRSPFGKTNR
jgi:hypothetical protein